MVVSQTPLRLSFVGGGTDFASFYKAHKGQVISATIDKYIYVIIKKRFDDLIVLHYTENEIVENVADIKHDICRAYDVECCNAGVAFRGSFLIDKKGVVRHQVVNDLPLGRNVDEMLRMIDALQFTEEHGEVCPAGWSKGKAGMKASTTGVAEYLAAHAKEL